jgi:hypothetical protein
MGRIYSEIDAFLTADGWPFGKLEDQTIAKTSFQGKNGEFNCFIQAREEQDHMVMYSVLPVFAPPIRQDEVAGFITRANSGMIIGNFELDYQDGEVRFKTSVDLEDVNELRMLLRNMIYANVLTMDKYLPGLMRVIYGGVSAVEAIKEIEGI